MLVKQKFLQFALVIFVGASALAQQKPASDATPSVERLRAHITYLASDQLEGRRTGLAGANAAAEYIAKEFARIGLKRSSGIDRPGMSRLEASSPRRYLQEFPFVAGVTLGRNNSLLFTTHAATTAVTGQASITGQASATVLGPRAAALDLRPGEDWTPLGISTNANILNAPATFVGYGIKAAELNHDDYAGADLKGRIAIALAGTPDKDNPHGQFARFADVRWKAIAAREAGAVALLIIAAEENFKDERLARLSYDNSAGDAGLPVAVISRQAAKQLMEAGGLSFLVVVEYEVPTRTAEAVRTVKVTTNSEERKNIAAPLMNVSLSLSIDIVRRSTPGANVIGILEGSDPQLKNEAIVIGAHYDHLGRGGEGSLATREGEIHHGADDNASGVAGMLELARIFSSTGMRPKRTLVFIAFSGEEAGLIGSNYYVNHPIVPLAQTVAMVNMDMIGRMKESRLLIGGVGTAAEWRGWIDAANRNGSAGSGGAATSPSVPVVVGIDGRTVMSAGSDGKMKVDLDDGKSINLTLNEDGFGPSDHSSFYAKQVPVLFFFTGTHEDYHKPSDTADKINYESEVRVLSLVGNIIRSIDASARRPTYAVAKSEGTRRSMNFRVTLGVVPNYAESTDGMKIDGVRDGSPAAQAGLLAGDTITKLAGRVVRSVYDYTAALGEMKAGEAYEVEIKRGGETLKLKITPAVRK